MIKWFCILYEMILILYTHLNRHAQCVLFALELFMGVLYRRNEILV